MEFEQKILNDVWEIARKAFRICADALPLPTGASTSENQTSGNQVSRILDSWGDYIGSTFVDEMMTAEKHRIAGGKFNGTTPDPNFFVTTLVANATANITNETLDLATTTDSNSSAIVYTDGVGRYIGGNMGHLRGVIYLPDSGAPNNVRRFGVTKDATLADSLYFQLEGSVFSVVAKTTGLSDVKIDNGSFNGDSPTYNLKNNFLTIEILFTNKTIKFYIDGTLVHTLSETTSAICGTRNFRPFIQNKNTGVGQVTHGYCQVLTLFSWGNVKTQPKNWYHEGQTVGTVLKVGAGSLHSIIVSGVINNANIDVYDGLSTAGKKIWSSGAMTNQTAPYPIPFNSGIPFNDGLFVVKNGANCNSLVSYE